MKKLDLLNQRFGRLVVVAPSKSKNNETMWECKCDCGNIKIVSTSNLKAGRIKSCGCFKSDKLIKRNTTHSQRHTFLYEVWKSLRQRCNNPKHASYYNYGGRGITICEEWNKSFQSFYDWAYANGYSLEHQKDEVKKLTIDRIDVNGNYEPNNCRWVDRKTQARNTRITKFITFKGQTKPIVEWCEIYGIKRNSFDIRIKCGWSIEEALTTPIKTKKSK